jgi:hypothetical protein
MTINGTGRGTKPTPHTLNRGAADRTLTVKSLGRKKRMKEDPCGDTKFARSMEVAEKQLDEEKTF